MRPLTLNLKKHLITICYLIFRLGLSLRFRQVGVKRDQVVSYYLMQKFLKLCNEYEITVWIFGGTLLGAIRNQEFAGRPGDLDFFVRDNDLKRIIQILESELFLESDLIRKLPLLCRTFRIDQQSNIGSSTQYFKFYFLGKSLQTFEIRTLMLVIDDGQRYFEFDSIMYLETRDRILAREFEALRKSQIYCVQVNVLENSEEYLESHFGSDWMIPRAGRKALREIPS